MIVGPEILEDSRNSESRNNWTIDWTKDHKPLIDGIQFATGLQPHGFLTGILSAFTFCQTQKQEFEITSVALKLFGKL